MIKTDITEFEQPSLKLYSYTISINGDAVILPWVSINTVDLDTD